MYITCRIQSHLLYFVLILCDNYQSIAQCNKHALVKYNKSGQGCCCCANDGDCDGGASTDRTNNALSCSRSVGTLVCLGLRWQLVNTRQQICGFTTASCLFQRHTEVESFIGTYRTTFVSHCVRISIHQGYESLRNAWKLLFQRFSVYACVVFSLHC